LRRKHGTYLLVLNTILNFDNLNAGRKLAREIAAILLSVGPDFWPGGPSLVGRT
jgi:hypothetical protein